MTVRIRRGASPSAVRAGETPSAVVNSGASGPNLTTMSSARLRHRRQPAAALAWWTAAVAGATTVAVIGLPFLRFAYRAPAFHVVLETTNAVIALVVAYLVYGGSGSAGEHRTCSWSWRCARWPSRTW